MPSWAITHRIAHCPGGRTPLDQIGNQKMAQVALELAHYTRTTLFMGLSGLWHNVTEYTKFFVHRE